METKYQRTKREELSAHSAIQYTISCNNSSLFVFFFNTLITSTAAEQFSHSPAHFSIYGKPWRLTYIWKLMKFCLYLCVAYLSIDIKYFHLWYTKSTCPFFDWLLCFRLWLMKIMRNTTYMQCVFGAATTSLVYHALLLSANINITPSLPVALAFCVHVRVHMCACLVW